jgi:gliding motility-associated-like protein
VPSASFSQSTSITDNHGCQATASINVTVTPAPVANFSGGASGCAPLSATLNNLSTGANSYTWDLDDGNSSILINPVVNYSAAGCKNITLIASNATGCKDTITKPCFINVNALPNAELHAIQSVVSELNPIIDFINESSGAVSCLTMFGDSTQSTDCASVFNHQYPGPGTYNVIHVVTNASGCIDTFRLTVKVEEATTIWVPNAFTPNSNGENDVFQAKGYGISEFSMLIYNRWGEKIFESNDINKGWDGTYKGSEVEQDIYVWTILYRDEHSKKTIKGTVCVIK